VRPDRDLQHQLAVLFAQAFGAVNKTLVLLQAVNLTFAIGGAQMAKSQYTFGSGVKSLHYTSTWPSAITRGRGCSGRLSLSWASSSATPFSGCV